MFPTWNVGTDYGGVLRVESEGAVMSELEKQISGGTDRSCGLCHGGEGVVMPPSADTELDPETKVRLLSAQKLLWERAWEDEHQKLLYTQIRMEAVNFKWERVAKMLGALELLVSKMQPSDEVQDVLSKLKYLLER